MSLQMGRMEAYVPQQDCRSVLYWNQDHAVIITASLLLHPASDRSYIIVSGTLASTQSIVYDYSGAIQRLTAAVNAMRENLYAITSNYSSNEEKQLEEEGTCVSRQHHVTSIRLLKSTRLDSVRT